MKRWRIRLAAWALQCGEFEIRAYLRYQRFIVRINRACYRYIRDSKSWQEIAAEALEKTFGKSSDA